MADKKARGLYLVWADVPADMEEDFNRWYNEEHLAELLAIPGVLSAARYVAVSGSPKYLCAYELDNPEVRDTPEYGEHLGKPTEWSQRVNLQARASRMIQNNYRQIFPLEVSSQVAESDMAPVLMIGRMSIPKDDENEFNEFYNTSYAPNFEKVPGLHQVPPVRAAQGARAQVRHGVRARAREGLSGSRLAGRQAEVGRRHGGYVSEDVPRRGVPGHLQEDIPALELFLAIRPADFVSKG